MTTDLALAIVTWAERKARYSRSPVWSYVMEILTCGCTSACEFCHEHMPRNGWKRTDDEPPPEETVVLASEGIGCFVSKYKRVGFQWFRIKGSNGREEAVQYTPSWWKELRPNGRINAEKQTLAGGQP